MGGNTVLAIAALAFVLALAGSVHAIAVKSPLPCWDNACPDGTFFAGCCDADGNGVYEEKECASAAAWKYWNKDLTLDKACAELSNPDAVKVMPRAEFTLGLKPGWNLVSVPVANYQQIQCVRAPCYQPMPANLMKNTCGAGTKVFEYDREYNRYADITNKLYNELYPAGGFEAGKSYWVKVVPTSSSAGCEMVFDGTHRMFGGVDPLAVSSLPPAAPISSGSGWALSPGWNNVGAPIDNVEFKKVSGACTLSSSLWRYNTAARRWEKAEVLKPGEGYFVKASADCNLGFNPAPSPTPAPSDRETIEIPTVQCMGNAWEMDWLKTHDAAQYPPKQGDAARQIIKAYYEKLGFTVYSVGFRKTADVVCLACGCSEGYSVLLTVSAADAQSYCERDSDCVRQGSCCGCGLGAYVNKKYLDQVFCEGQCRCLTIESRGVCVDNKCKAVPLTATATPSPSSSVSRQRQLTFTADTVYNLMGFSSVNGRRLVVYWKRPVVWTGEPRSSRFGTGGYYVLDADSGVETKLNTDIDNIGSISGSMLAYAKNDNCVYSYDLEANVEKQLACGSIQRPYFPAFAAGGKVFFLEQYFEYPQPYPARVKVNYQVYSADVASGEVRPAFLVNKNFHGASDGVTLAWYEPSSYYGGSDGLFEGPTHLYVYDIASASLSEVTPENGDLLGSVAVSGGKVAFSDMLAVEGAGFAQPDALYAYDSASGRLSTIDATPTTHISPHISGNFLAWVMGGTADDSQIWLYDFSTQTKKQITSGAVFHLDPKMLGNSLAYSGGAKKSGDAWAKNNIFLIDEVRAS
ncbi:MAG: hypothetical protein V1787_03660 [Candidatus Micrarchaeota archaeon]